MSGISVGSYLVYIFFLLLFVWWGRRIVLSGFTMLGKTLSILAIVIAFLIVQEEAAEIWIFLRFDVAVVVGFLWGIFLPYGRPAFQLPQRKMKTSRRQHTAESEIDHQKQAAEDDLRRQEREASERLRQEQKHAEENLRHETERVKREADERVKEYQRQAEARAREEARKQRQQTQREKTKKQPDPYEILGIKRGATKAEIKW